MSPALIAIIVFMGVGLLGFLLYQAFGGSRRLDERISQVVDGAMDIDEDEIAEIQGRSPKREERLPGLARLVQGRAFTEKLERRLVSAGLPLRPAEFMAIWGAAITGCVLIALLFARGKMLVLLIAAGVGVMVPNNVLNFLYNRRRMTLEAQLADALTMVASGLKAGYNVLQGMQSAADQLPDPIASEFGRVAKLVNVGMDLGAALSRMGQRIQSYDYDITITAIQIQTRSGGNLAGLLESIANTIRERITLRREINAATAQGKLSGLVLIGLPILIAVGLAIINRAYFNRLFTPLGKKLLWVAAIQQGIGIWLIKRLLNFEA